MKKNPILFLACILVLLTTIIVWKINDIKSSSFDLPNSMKQETPSLPRVNDRIDVKDIGAAGNGYTDDTNAFQTAIDQASKNGGGNVYIPAGTYILNSLYLKSNVNLIGENRDLVTLKLTDNANDQEQTRLLNISEVKNVKVQNITFDGNYEKHKKGIEHMHDIFIWDSNNVLIDYCRMQNAVADGISVTGSKKASNNVIISNNILINNHRSNLVIEQVNNINIFNNFSKSEIGRPTLHFEPFKEVQLQNAKIYNNTFDTNATEYDSIQIMGGTDSGRFHGIEFHNNIVKGKNTRITITRTVDAKIKNNDITTKDVNIWFQNDNLALYKNIINTKNGVLIEGEYGKSVGTEIYDNKITTDNTAIAIRTDSIDTLIKGNTFIGEGNKDAIFLWALRASIQKTHFINNTFTNFDRVLSTDFYQESSIKDLVFQGNQFNKFKNRTTNSSRPIQNLVVNDKTYSSIQIITIK
ncbi:glycosyl hydrolase family 28-related protein [Neobacillus sp. NRS-1170]|uniref:glycosyl hydrolase family 28-related protein n=1 Tax=Neobacillus sp. NRS-1170 TaxID=3233898 RepID=UPI003D2D14FF